MYQNIKADQGTVSFANSVECQVASTLLKSMILCISKSSRDTFSKRFLSENKTYEKVQKCEKVPIDVKDNQETVLVPKDRCWTNTFRIRKITFSSRVDNQNPAPDPVLLLGKAASNWLKRNQLCLLPGCDDGDSSSGSSSDFVASFRDEMAVRGWPSDMFEQSHLNDVIEVNCVPDDAVDEALSDDESL